MIILDRRLQTSGLFLAYSGNNMVYLKNTGNNLFYKVNDMEKEIFDKEQEHLTKVYGKLMEMKKKLEDQIAALDEKAVDDKNDIRDNIRFDYADIETTMETLAEIEVWNRYIDTYNVESSSLGKRLSTVNKLLESPYFAKIQLQFDPSEEPESYYIGRAAISENGYDQMVVDWRSPIAEVYYNQEMGSTHYTVEERQIPVDLKLRRQFDLKKDKLLSYFDTQIAIEDPMLLQSLSQTRSDASNHFYNTKRAEHRYQISGCAGSFGKWNSRKWENICFTAKDCIPLLPKEKDTAS